MWIQDGNTSSESGRTAIDRQAVSAAGQLLMSAIWLEHRARRFSKRLNALPSQRSSVASFVGPSVTQKTDQEVLVDDACSA